MLYTPGSPGRPPPHTESSPTGQTDLSSAGGGEEQPAEGHEDHHDQLAVADVDVDSDFVELRDD